MMRSGEVITGNWKVVCSPAVSPQGQRCATWRRVLTAQVFTELQREYDGNPHLDSREGGRRGYAPDVPHGLMRLSAFARDGKNHCLRQALGYPETTIADTCVLTASEVNIMGLANIEIASPLTTRKSLRPVFPARKTTTVFKRPESSRVSRPMEKAEAFFRKWFAQYSLM